MLYIDGEWRSAASGRTFESFDPATGAVIDRVADAGVDDLDAAVAATTTAFGAWSGRKAWPSTSTPSWSASLSDLTQHLVAVAGGVPPTCHSDETHG